MTPSFEKQFDEHEAKDEKRFARIDEKLDVIKDNHLHHIQKSMASLEANYTWVKYLLGILIAAILSGFVALVYQLATK